MGGRLQLKKHAISLQRFSYVNGKPENKIVYLTLFGSDWHDVIFCSTVRVILP
jgi:hypothetical protein